LVAEANPFGLTCGNVDYILSGLTGAQVEEKRLARIVLEAVKDLIEIGEPGSVKHLLPIAKRYLGLRIEDIGHILYYLKTARLEPFRAIVTKVNEDFMSRLKRITSLLDKGDYRPALNNAYGLWKTIRPYLAEPDLEGLDSMVWPVIIELKKLRGAALWMELVRKKVEDSQRLNEFMALFRTEYVRRRLEGNKPYLKEDTFIDMFENFIKAKQLIRGSPGARALQILCYLAAFVPLEIGNPLKPSVRIPNPVFKPINTLRLIVEADDIETILTIKRLKKLPETRGIFNEFKAKRFIRKLDWEERRLLIRAMAEDFGLTDKERFELARAFAITRENLRKSCPDSADEPSDFAAALDTDIQNAINLKTALAKFYEYDAEKITYTIRLDANRVPADYIDLIKKYYTKILSSDKVEVRVFGNGKTKGLIDVSIDIGGRNDGNGTVDVKGDKGQIESLGRLIGMVNLAISVAALPEEFPESGISTYQVVLDIILAQYQLLTGEKLVLPANPKDIFSFIHAIAQSLPPVKVYGVKAQEEFKLMEEKLSIAA
ncbi:MAG: hypothetical protein NTW09_03610, partial [Candidatus Omnitrophica bacterium]|nr:hypothetical protein [Candidatus Omnitrophota bacterium]